MCVYLCVCVCIYAHILHNRQNKQDSSNHVDFIMQFNLLSVIYLALYDKCLFLIFQ